VTEPRTIRSYREASISQAFVSIFFYSASALATAISLTYEGSVRASASLYSLFTLILKTTSVFDLSAGTVDVTDPALSLCAIEISISHGVAVIFFYSASAFLAAIAPASFGSSLTSLAILISPLSFSLNKTS